jgi:hypothetical protein
MVAKKKGPRKKAHTRSITQKNGLTIHEFSPHTYLDLCGRETHDFVRKAYPKAVPKGGKIPHKKLSALSVKIFRARKSEEFPWSYGRTRQEAVQLASTRRRKPRRKKAAPKAKAPVKKASSSPAKKPVTTVAVDANGYEVKLVMNGSKVEATIKADDRAAFHQAAGALTSLMLGTE